MVRALDTRPRDPWFNAQLMHYKVTTLGKLFTPTCLCRCKWTSGWCQSTTFRSILAAGCLQATLIEQVAYRLWGEGLVWLIGAVVCLLAANRGSNCSLRRAMYGRILRCGIISLWQSATTSRIVKRFCLVSVSCKKRYSKCWTLPLPLPDGTKHRGTRIR